MNSIAKSIMFLQLLALCLATAFADPDLKHKDLRGPVASFETTDINPITSIMLVDGHGTGTGTHLGQFAYSYEFVVDLTTLTAVGSAEFTAASGDSFFTEINPQPSHRNFENKLERVV